MIDEVLAVGDEVFQKKCLEKMNEFKRSGKTIFFVSHDLNNVKKLCDRSLLLDKGQVIAIGPTEAVIKEYLALVENK